MRLKQATPFFNVVICLLLFVKALLLGSSAIAQDKKPTTQEEYLVRTWKQVHDKILEMAKVIPEDKLSWRPHPDSRSIIEEFRHVTIALRFSSSEIRGEQFDYVQHLKEDSLKPPTKESVVLDMKDAIAVSYSLIEKKLTPRLVWWLEHQGEHYGKLVSNFRMNNIIPPVSR